MQAIRHSFVSRFLWSLLFLITRCYEGSTLALLLRGTASAGKRAWQESLTGRFLGREGALSRGFSHSVLGRSLSVLLNLPGFLCRALYRAGRKVLDNSAAARLGFHAAEETPAAVGWLMLLFLVIPYDYWNNAYSLMGFALLLVFAVLSCARRAHARLDCMSIGPYLTAFAGFVFLAWALSASSMQSQRYFFYHLSCILCVLVIVSTVERADQLNRLTGMASLGLIVISAYALFQRAQGVEVNPSYVDLTVNKDLPGRVFSFFENPNAFAEVLVLLIPLAVALLFAARGIFGRLLGLAGAGIGCVALIMTYSRASWVGLLAAAFVFVLLWKRQLLPLFLVLGIAAIPLLPDVILNRALSIFNLKDTSTSSRFPLYEAAWRLIGEHPLRGTGLGSDVVRMAVKDGNLYHGEAPFVHSHNVYLQIWAETGLFGLLALLGAAGHTLKRAASVAFGKLGSTTSRMTVIGGCSALFGILVCGIADFIWHYPRVMLIFWFVFALTLAALRLALREEQRPARRQRHVPEGGRRLGGGRDLSAARRNPRRGDLPRAGGRSAI